MISTLDARSGGTSEACAGLVAAQSRQGLAVRVVATQREREDSSVIEQLSTRLAGSNIRLIGPARGPLARHPAIKTVIRQELDHADVVHLHGVWEEIVFQAAHAAISRGIPVVWAPHGMLDPWSLAQSWLKKKIYWRWRWHRLSQKISALHCMTSSEARLLHETIAPTVKRIVEPLGTEIPIAAPPALTSSNVLFFSRLHPKKNVECLLRACAASAGKEWSLTIAGDGEASYRNELQDLSQDLGISDRVSFLGDLRGTRKTEAFRNAAVFCLPSHQENFGIVVIEALAAGLPMILSPQVGIVEDLFDLGQVEVAGNDPQVWAHKIEEMIADSDLRQRAATGGPDFVRQRFAWDAIGRNWVGHYAKLGHR
ncbi:MAG: glycosyltransferase [Chthoniobacterales bacterium]